MAANRTLIDVLDEQTSKLPAMIIKGIIETSNIYSYIPVIDKPTGKSTFNQRNVLYNPGHRNFSANYTASPYAPIQPVNVGLQPFGGSIAIDKELKSFWEAENGGSFEMNELEKMAEAIGLNLKSEMMSNAFYGIDQWLLRNASLSTVTYAANSGTPATIATMTLKQFIKDLNVVCNAGSGTGDAVIMCDQLLLDTLQAECFNGANSVLASSFSWQNVIDSSGAVRRSEARFNGIPMVAMGYNSQQTKIISTTLGGGSETRIYVVNMNPKRFAMLQSHAPAVEVTPQNGVIKDITVDFSCAFQVSDPKAARVLTGVLV